MLKEGFFRKSVLFIVFACGLLIGTVSRADSTDVGWRYICQQSSYWTAPRYKSNTSKVYCHPTSGHATKAEVYGSVTGNSNRSDYISRSGKHTIPVGTHGYITNYVKEKGGKYGALNLGRTVIDYTYCAGVWSVDSTGSGTIYN